ncbi:MAG: metallophosphoesterase [Pirellulales bacterium]|jgi:predicted MPP superfamily phosphohydrolase
MEWIILITGTIGHVGLWCVVFNRVHATAFPRKLRKLSEKAILAIVFAPLFWIFFLTIQIPVSPFANAISLPLIEYYFYGSVGLGFLFVVRWIYRKVFFKLPSNVLTSKTERLNLKKELASPLLHGRIPKFLGLFPFNEALLLTRQRMTIEVDMPPALDGLKICQLSDLHFTGEIDIRYFQRVVEEANQFQPDLVVVTGDLVDNAKCIEWIPETLGKLIAPLGVFYVLGNHDRQIASETFLRNNIQEAGLIQASSKWHQVKFNGANIQITGNALPWYRDAEQLSDQPDNQSGLSILLSHSPDQIDWARRRNFQLMFAGHTHGGQIAFPIIGPVVAPSKYGVGYSSGTFKFGNLIMHVSRGLSGDETIRWGSPPELGLFTLRSNQQ